MNHSQQPWKSGDKYGVPIAGLRRSGHAIMPHREAYFWSQLGYPVVNLKTGFAVNAPTLRGI